MVEIIVTVVLEAVKWLASPAQRQFSYLLRYDNNFQNLKKEMEEMKGDRQRVQCLVDEAKSRGEEICEIVDKWLKDVSDAIAEAEKLVDVQETTANKRCFKELCPNLKARFQLSKEVVRQQQEVISKLREKVGSLLASISYRPILKDNLLASSKDSETFESRRSTLNDILGALKNPGVNILGIYGMGGLGKTTLARKVAEQVKTDFDHVIFAEVSPSPNIGKIQEKLAGMLGLKFQEKNESVRASQLCNRLKKENTVLVILDNIWEKLMLQDVGIPCGGDHQGCKVLLTAREEKVLEEMDSLPNFQVGVLGEEEAWRLFKKYAGDYIEDKQFKSVAREVAKKCAGLPISIVMVGKQLKNKKLFVWKDALRRLREPLSEDFRDKQPAYSAIELSYNNLKGKKLKKIFLLIAYAYLESVDDLLRCGMGLGLFGKVNHMEKARNQVRTLVSELKESCMLLNHTSEDDEEWFSIHDVVRDVARSIASRDENVLSMIEDDDLPESFDENTVKPYTSIVLLDVKTDIVRDVLDCPQLKLFYIRAAEESSSLTNPDKFFSKMKQVKVLNLTNMKLIPLPSSLSGLTNLRSLFLCYCELEDIAVVGKLKKLQILCLEGSEIKKLPEEVGQLTHLKVFDLRWCEGLEVIPPNVLSKLSCLEELYIGEDSFDKWGEEVEGVKNASLDELKLLPNLTSLELLIKDVNTLPTDLFFEKLERFNICIGVPWVLDDSRAFSLDLTGTKICLKDGLIVQPDGVEVLSLSGLQDQDVKYLVDELVNAGSLQQLKHLSVKGYIARNSTIPEESISDMQSNEIVSDDSSFFSKEVAANLESLALHSINVERIWQNQLAAMSNGFPNLKELSISGCRNLKCLFSNSILSCCVQLQKLCISDCPLLKELIIVDPTERKKIVFDALQSLELKNSEKLTSFCTGDVLIEFPSLKELRIVKCPEFMAKYKNSNHDLTKEIQKESTTNMRSSEIISDDYSIFNEKVWVPKLDCLGVEEKDISWAFQYPEGFIRKLKILDVLVENETTIISSLGFLQRFHTIKCLIIFEERQSHQIYENGCILKPSAIFNDLETPDYHICEDGFTAVIRQDLTFCDWKSILKPSAIFNDLETLLFYYLECDNLINLMPSSAAFHNLTTLLVYACDGFMKLLTSSTAKSLVRLREMGIVSCKSIREIVTDDEGDNVAKDEIIFKELKELDLHDLKNLISFYSGNCSLKFPSLETLVVDDCPNMKIFFDGELKTPKLYEVQLDSWNEKDVDWKGDLNTTIEHQYYETEESSEED